MLRPFIFRCYFSHIFESRALLLRSYFVDFYMFCSHLTLRLFVFFQMYIYMCVCVMYILVKEQAQRHRKMSWLVNFSFWNVPFVLPIPFKRFCNAFVYASTYKLSEEGVSEMESETTCFKYCCRQCCAVVTIDFQVFSNFSQRKKNSHFHFSDCFIFGSAIFDRLLALSVSFHRVFYSYFAFISFCCSIVSWPKGDAESHTTTK